MEIMVWVGVAVALVGVIGLYQNKVQSLRGIAFGFVAFGFFLSVFVAHLDGQTKAPWASNFTIADTLKTGTDYTVLGSYPVEDEFLYIIKGADGLIRTVRSAEIPPQRFVVVKDRLVELK